MRKFILSIAAAASLAAGVFTMPAAEAAPILSQAAIGLSAQHALPTDQVRYRRNSIAPRRHGPRVVYRTVYRTRYVYARPHVRRRRPLVRYYQSEPVYDAPSYYPAPVYAPQVYVPPQVYPQPYYDTPVYSAPAYVPPVVSPGWGGRGGGWQRHGGGAANGAITQGGGNGAVTGGGSVTGGGGWRGGHRHQN